MFCMNAWRAACRFQYYYHTTHLGRQCTPAVALGTVLVGSKACSKALGSVTRMVSGGAVHVQALKTDAYSVLRCSPQRRLRIINKAFCKHTRIRANHQRRAATCSMDCQPCLILVRVTLQVVLAYLLIVRRASRA